MNYEVVTGGVSNVFAKGVNPGTPPTFADRGALATSGVHEPHGLVRVLDPGRYLVICNVRGHFMDGMYAWIKVVDVDDDNDN